MKQRIGWLAVACLWAGQSQAAGFALEDFSASGMGVGNAVVATVDDASAAAYNPAGVAWQPGLSIMVGPSWNFRKSSVKVAGGVAPNTGKPPHAINLSVGWMPKGGNLGLAVAINTPFGVVNRWGVFPTSSDFDIKAQRLSADVVYALSSNLAIAAGPDYYYSKLRMSQGASNFQATDKASFGGHLGLRWTFAPAWSAGLMLRSGASLSFNASPQKASIKLPDSLAVGVAHVFDDTYRLEADLDWTRWSRLNSLNVTGGAAQTNAVNLKDSYALKTGLTWFWRENTQWRFGYAYDTGASSASGYQPAVSDQSSHRLSVGAGGDAFNMHFDAALAYVYQPKKQVTGTFAGEYRSRYTMLGLSISKTF